MIGIERTTMAGLAGNCAAAAGESTRVPRLPAASSVAACFERVVQANPAAPALVSPAATRSYGELNGEANRIAHAVDRAVPGGSGAIATLLADPAAQVATMLAACKLGRPYVPLDAGCPVPRGAFVLADVEADVVVTDAQSGASARAMAGSACVVLDVAAIAAGVSDANPGRAIAPDATLWVMYTSGTTGEPKGVLQTHRNLLRYVHTYVGGFALGPGTRLLTLMSLTASGGGHDALMTLLTGGTLQTWNARRDGVAGLPAWIDARGSTMISTSPTVFRQLAAALAPARRLASVRIVKLWAELAYRRDFDAFCRHFADDAVLVNRLGSTEQGSTLWCFLRKDSAFDGLHLPAGYPAEDPSVLLLGEDGKAVADGEVGEIVARSAYLSPGYWKRDKETAAAFSVDPDDPGLRRYRTGDMGYRRADGCIVCVGRKDGQVKIRGNRVEVAEVEHALLAHPAIRDAVVASCADPARPDEQRLAAYYIALPGVRVSAGELRRFVASRLPDFMVPAALVRMERFPQSANGKVLRRALPAPRSERPELDVPWRAAGNGDEEALLAIWTDVLQYGGIGVDDPFLDLGGDSIQAMQIVARVVERFALDLSPSSVLKEATIATLARMIGASRAAASGAQRGVR